MQLMIEIKNTQDLDTLLTIFKRFSVKVIEKKQQVTKSPILWLDQLAAQGGISSIKNASEWQRETRKDRHLPFRD